MLKLTYSFFYLCLLFLSCESKKSIKTELNDISLVLNQYNPTDPDTYKGEHVVSYINYSVLSNYVSGTTIMKDYKYNTQSDLVLIQDTVYQIRNGVPQKFSGKVRVVGKMDYINEFQKSIYNEHATLALFNVNNGIFEGDQIYYSPGDYRQNLNNFYFKCEIKPYMEAIYGMDYAEVGPNDSYDFSFGGGVYSTKYYKIFKPRDETFVIQRIWKNGKLFDSHKYNFNVINFINASLNRLQYRKGFNLVNEPNSQIYHYNGNLAFYGIIDALGKLENGKYFNFSNVQTDFSHFKLQKSFTSELNANALNFSTISDEDFKAYRIYFNVFNVNDGLIF